MPAIERATLGTLGWLGVPVVLALGLTFTARPSVAAVATPRPAPFDVRAVYLRDCATCHGARGEGTARGPGIATAGAALTDYELSTGRMPLDDPDELVHRRAPRYSPAQIAALVDHVSSFGGGGGVPIPSVDIAGADVARGGELYRLNCAACHSWSGTGGALLGREAPPLAHSTPLQVGEAVRSGPGSMPSFGRESIGDDDLDAVAAYVKEIQHPQDRGGDPLLHLGPFPEGAVAWVFGIGALLLFVNWVGEREPQS